MSDQTPNYKQRRALAVREMRDTLRERFPLAFPADPEMVRPLKIGIREDLLAVLGENQRALLSIFMRGYIHRLTYQRALTLYRVRLALDGSVAGEVTDEEQEIARAELKAIKASYRAKDQAERKAAKATAKAEAKPKPVLPRLPTPALDSAPGPLGLRPMLSLKKKEPLQESAR